MQLFTIIFARPIEFGISIGIALLVIVIFLRAAMVAEGATTGSAAITGPNGSSCSASCSSLWAVVFGIGLQLVPARRRELARTAASA